MTPSETTVKVKMTTALGAQAVMYAVRNLNGDWLQDRDGESRERSWGPIASRALFAAVGSELACASFHAERCIFEVIRVTRPTINLVLVSEAQAKGLPLIVSWYDPVLTVRAYFTDKESVTGWPETDPTKALRTKNLAVAHDWLVKAAREHPTGRQFKVDGIENADAPPLEEVVR